MRISKILSYVPLALLFFLLILTITLLREVVVVFLFAILMSYLLQPVHRFLRRFFEERTSAVLTCMLVLLAVGVLFIIGIIFLLPEVQTLLGTIRDFSFDTICTSDICSSVLNHPIVQNGRDIITGTLKVIGNTALQMLTALLQEIPLILLKVLLFMLLLYFGVRDGPVYLHQVKSLIPLEKRDLDALERKAKSMVDGVLYGGVVVVVLQGSLAALGYFVAGVNSPLFFGLLTMLAALIPFVGTALVWVPLSLLALGDAADPWSFAHGIFLIIYSLLIVSLADNVVKPFIIEKRTGLHPLIAFLGVLGGFKVFGLLGFLLGPVTLALFITMLDIIHMRYVSRTHR